MVSNLIREGGDLGRGDQEIGGTPSQEERAR